MRKTGLWLLAALAVAVPASAQAPAGGTTKMTGKVHCAKPDPESMLEVGDKPGHMLTMRKAECTWTGGEIAGMSVKSATDFATGEMSGGTARDNGYHVATLDNGDKYTVRFSGAAKLGKDNTGTIEGKWTFVSGTGKIKGITGGGTYKGTANADGSGDIDVEGEYTVAPAKPSAPAPAAKKK